jgi:PAS domain S-box-containing protein
MKSNGEKTLLLVDDEAIIAMAEKTALEKYGYVVMIANTGEEAVTAIEKTPAIDLILMDINLGAGMDGTEAAALILRQRDLPVVFLSSHMEPEIVEKTEKITSYGYVVKDSSSTVLDASIKMAFKLFEAKRNEKEKESQIEASLEAIRKSEEKYRKLFYDMWDGFALHEILCDDQGTPTDYRFLEVNPAFERITGLSSAELIGRTVMEVLPSTERTWIEIYGKVALTGEPLVFENYSGEMQKHFMVTAFQPKPNQFACIFVDITERKQALRDSEEKFRIIFEDSPQGIIAIDIETHRLLYANPAACRMFQHSEEEFLSLEIADLHPKDSLGHVLAEFESQMRGNKPISIEVPCLRKDGTIFFADIVGAATVINERKCNVGFFTDATERKKIEEQLLETSDIQKIILDSLKETVWGLRLQDYKYLYISAAAKTLYERPISEWEANPNLWRDSIFQEDQYVAEQIWNEVTTLGFSQHEYRIITPDNKIKWVSNQVQLIKNNKNIPEMITGITSDISDRKWAEKALQLMNDELEQRVAERTKELFQANENLRESEEKFRSMAEQLDEVLYATDIDGIITYISPSASRVFGWLPGEMIGKSFVEFLPESEIPNAIQAFQSTLSSGKPSRNLSLLMKRKDNNVFIGELLGSHLEKKPGLAGTLGLIRDITKKRQAEDLLRQTHQNYETFFNTTNDLLFVLDEQGDIIYINSRVNERLGYSGEELYGKSVLTIHPPERRAEADGIIKQILSGQTLFCPIPIMTKSGIQLPVETRVSRGFWDSKPVIFGVSKDISEIKLSEEKFSKAFYLNPSACGLTEIDNDKYVEVNEAFCTLFGLGKDEIIGKSPLDLGLLNLEMANAVSQKEDSRGNVTNFQIEMKSKTGEIKHVLLSSECIAVQNKKYRYAVANDITERMQAETALRESEEWTKIILQTVLSGVLVIEVATRRIVEANEMALELLGLPKNQVVGFVCHKFVCPAEQKNCPIIDLGKEVDSSEKILLTANGKQKNVIKTVRPVQFHGREFLIESFVDITERKQAERELLEEKVLVDTVLENVPLMIFLKEAKELRFALFNRAGEELLGYARESLLGKSDLDFFPAEQAAYFIAKDREVLAGEAGMLDIAEELIQTAKKGQRLLHTRKVSIRGNDGIAKYLLGISEDITERKKAEEEIKRQLSEKAILLKEVHHRIKNNIASIGGLLSLQMQTVTNAEAGAVLQEAIGRVNSMRILYDKLLLSDDYKIIPVKNYVDSLIDTIGNLFHDKAKIKFSKQIADFHLNSKQLFPLGIIINELLTNKMKYAFIDKEAGLIRISLKKAEAQVTLAIEDDGNLLPDGFDVNEAKGFGLMLVRMLSQQLGGSFSMASKAGTRCTVEFKA